MERIKNTLDGSIGQTIYDLWKEYEDGTTKEAQIVKQFDKLEMIMQAHEYEQGRTNS